ncbi:TIR domain-containing protein [Enterococcus faecium]|uniref:TIR domain-containing protein n=1 Tax=Enterococcus faecium TaxID=1352 RepID=UPI00124D164E|nr:TIR domain-containing protein [Enterococcus faecium]KAB2118977.1 molecular chaperone Tir [Enterococcus faecium]KAB2120160.1 molecular chaperone Tir [Enterococcus faecium]KAB2127963.1 molecular chaperone Tir [Enterococcus faecium]KAB2131592.1 molecular chaperone Tir [Enterococcus faecium]KAB2132234.1 molecular chaperone Tir [Enterococcus faecium]
MVRRVFFSFHYADVTRAMVVRNSWTLRGTMEAGFVDKAEFEKVKRNGDIAIKNWIDNQLIGTSVTVVLIGKETLDREYVKYEIQESYKRGNAILAVNIGKIKDFNQMTTTSQSVIKIIGQKPDGEYLWFDEIIDGQYDYISDDGYNNLGTWIDSAAYKKGK